MAVLSTLYLVHAYNFSYNSGGQQDHTVFIRNTVESSNAKRSYGVDDLPTVLPVEIAAEDGIVSRLVLRANPRIPNDIGVRFDNEELNKRKIPSLQVGTIANIS